MRLVEMLLLGDLLQLRVRAGLSFQHVVERRLGDAVAQLVLDLRRGVLAICLLTLVESLHPVDEGSCRGKGRGWEDKGAVKTVRRTRVGTTVF